MGILCLGLIQNVEQYVPVKCFLYFSIDTCAFSGGEIGELGSRVLCYSYVMDASIND